MAANNLTARQLVIGAVIVATLVPGLLWLARAKTL